MVKALFDTNILIDYLNGIDAAREEIGRYRDRAISIISWMEAMISATPELETPTRTFLEGFELIGLDDRIADRAVALRRARRMRLPDAIIWASARDRAAILVTRNSRDFPEDDPGVRIPYRVPAP